jgi:putative transposase
MYLLDACNRHSEIWSGHSPYNGRQAQFPKCKRRGPSDSFRYSGPNELKLDQVNGRILLPRLGWLRYRNSRNVLRRIRNVTVGSSGKKWFISVLAVREVERPIAKGPAVGIDMGIVRFATLSEGRLYTPLNSFQRHENALAAAQRALSRKTQVLAMSKSDGIAAKRRLNRSILDPGWFEFRRQLEYKLRWNGGRLIAVSPRNTSITCPRCRHVGKENRVNQAQFECVACGLRENADRVGALDVLSAGHARFACAETSRGLGRRAKNPLTRSRKTFDLR